MPSVARWIWFPFRVTLLFLVRNGWRIAISLLGLVLVSAGIVLLVLPGPGLLVIIAGFAVLAMEYVWAQRALNFARRQASAAKDRVLGRPPREDGPHG
jgi:uncharacterized protein (TIGR02611 family)